MLLFLQSDKTIEFFISIYSICLNANLIITHSSSQLTVTHIQNSRVTLLHSQIKQSKFSRNQLLTIQSIYLNTNFNITNSSSHRTVRHIQNSHFWLSQSDKAVRTPQLTIQSTYMLWFSCQLSILSLNAEFFPQCQHQTSHQIHPLSKVYSSKCFHPAVSALST